MPAVEEDDALNANDSRSDLFDFFDKGDTKPNTCFGSLQGIIRVDGDVHDGDFFSSGAKENHGAHGSLAPTAVERKERLGFEIANLDRETDGRFNNFGVTEALKGIKNAFSDEVLAGIEKEEFFQLGAALFGNTRRKDDVHERFLDSTRFQRLPAD